jgi:hypothetical protein
VREKVPVLKCLTNWKIGYFGMRSAPDTLVDEEEEDYSLGESRDVESVVNDKNDNIRQRSSDSDKEDLISVN